MATPQELTDLRLHWSQVITTIYPDIGVVVKGDPDSVETLLSVWSTGNPVFDEPTEPELLTALATVLAGVAVQDAVEVVKSGAETQASSIPNFASWTLQEFLDWIDANIGDTQIDAMTSLADAKVVMKKQTTAFTAIMRFVVAFRNELYPHLEGS